MSERATDTGCYDTSGLSIQQDWQDALLESYSRAFTLYGVHLEVTVNRNH